MDTILEVTKGETLFLKILTPEGGWLEVEGMVAHHSPRLGFGVQFVNLNEEQRSSVRALAKQFQPAKEARAEPPWRFDNIDVSSQKVLHHG